ncbi:ETC complex I subunit [Rickettsiales bacterium]|jgi:hypothetical protein|nr:ETC complex I subunit [Rickettsiales bacterium]|tara:strand:+ start:3421 stop:3717 length:297 start_codon:yes stop_codon:yes gene_type:complete
MQAIIYQKSKCSNHPGIYAKEQWYLKISSNKNYKKKSNIMNWLGNSNMNDQIDINFSSKDLAINYAKKHNIEYEILEISQVRIKSKSYADNFCKPILD